jgi:hypothetical protein
MSGLMSEVWKRSQGSAIGAPPDEKGGNSRLSLTPPRHISTLPNTEVPVERRPLSARSSLSYAPQAKLPVSVEEAAQPFRRDNWRVHLSTRAGRGTAATVEVVHFKMFRRLGSRIFVLGEALHGRRFKVV